MSYLNSHNFRDDVVHLQSKIKKTNEQLDIVVDLMRKRSMDEEKIAEEVGKNVTDIGQELISVGEKMMQGGNAQRKHGAGPSKTEPRAFPFAFGNLTLRPELMRALQTSSQKRPTHFQEEAIPMMLTGKDFFLQAPFNSGKARSFVLSTLERFDPTDKDLTILVLCANQSIARQVLQMYKFLGKFMGNISMFTCGGLNGKGNCRGHPMKGQCKLTPQIVVSTPACIWDLCHLKMLKLDKVKQFVLYDCDKIMDDHMERSCIQSVAIKLSEDKQSLVLGIAFTDVDYRGCTWYMKEPKVVIFHNDMNRALHHPERVYVIPTEVDDD